MGEYEYMRTDLRGLAYLVGVTLLILLSFFVTWNFVRQYPWMAIPFIVTQIISILILSNEPQHI